MCVCVCVSVSECVCVCVCVCVCIVHYSSGITEIMILQLCQKPVVQLASTANGSSGDQLMFSVHVVSIYPSGCVLYRRV